MKRYIIITILYAAAVAGGRAHASVTNPDPDILKDAENDEKAERRGKFRVPYRKIDANGDLLIDDDEMEAGFNKRIKKIRKRIKKILRRHNSDGDGQLNEDERRAFESAHAKRAKKGKHNRDLLQADSNGDVSLSDEEIAAFKEEFVVRIKKHNKRSLKKHDSNGDGKLDADEIVAAKERMEKRREQARERRAARRTEEE